MAKIGNITLGGYEVNATNDTFSSGIAYKLSSASDHSELYKYENGLWEVELKKKHGYIVARCKKKIPEEDIVILGFEYCQKTLDIISVVQKIQLLIIEPAESYLLLYKEDDSFIFREVSMSDISIGISAQITKYDKDGNQLVEPVPIPPVWTEAFRFYRISQSSNDLFEAYRNLFLALEAILYIICPKQKEEGERAWLRRALNKISGIGQFVPNNISNPSDYLVVTQYDSIRCKLFHAKGSNIILPYENLHPQTVALGYEQLLNIWRHIASVYFNVPGGGGVMTCQGFKTMMERCLEYFNFYHTNDSSTPQEDDTEISPLNQPVFAYDQVTANFDYMPGYVALYGSRNSDISDFQIIHRICVKVEDTLFSVAYYKDGIVLTGINEFQSKQILRLINKNMPRTLF